MDHFIEIKQLSLKQVEALLERASSFKHSTKFPHYPEVSSANLFYENSTRTRVSFELAAKRLGMAVVNVDIANSSESKGELIEDTLRTLMAMGIKLFVIRHAQDGIMQHLATTLGKQAHLVNAGDGQHAHPSQALLDLMTITEHKKDLSALKIAIVGDLRHSRVANSLQELCALMQVGELTLVAPSLWQPQQVRFGKATANLRQGITDADVIVCLRVQRERLAEDEHLDLAGYREQFSLTTERLQWAKPDALVMHPGPLNRGVEIDSEVADGAQSVILQQVTNGVFMRMAILESLCVR